MPFVEIDGLNVHYQQEGSGHDVVLLHAFTSNLSMWMLTGLMGKLAAKYRVTCYDLRGHGASTRTDDHYGSDTLAHDFKKLHDRLGLDEAHLIGHSYGGVVAIHAAVLFPETVTSIILSDVYFPGLRDLEPDMGQAGPWKELRSQLLTAGVDIGEEVDFGGFFERAEAMTPEQKKKLQKTLGPIGASWVAAAGRLAGTTAAVDAFSTSGLTAERIASVNKPVIGLYDEHSPFTATADYLKSNLSDCTLDVVPGAKHLAPVENAEAFGGLVLKHLEQLESRCGS